ncbi:ABC transporter transmembrane domain-containing protein [Dermabacteraceae bacterium P13115]|nr:ABC transporter ATP-binding protein/permease [Dermabacteraceae bacterium TAE3-ERU5]
MLRALIWRNRYAIAVVLFLGLLGNASVYAQAGVVGYAIDHGITAQDPRVILLCILALLGVTLMSGIGFEGSFVVSRRVEFTEDHRMRVRIASAILDPRSRAVARPSGELLSLATSDLRSMTRFVQMCQIFVPTLISLIIPIAVIAWIDYTLGLICLVGIALVVLVAKVLTPYLARTHKAEKATRADASALGTDIVHGLRVIQGLGVQRSVIGRYRRTSRAALRASIDNVKVSTIGYALPDATGLLMVAALTAASGIFALEGRISIGELVMVLALARTLAESLWIFGEFTVFYSSIIGSAQRLQELLDELGDEHRQPPSSETLPPGDLSLEGLPLTSGAPLSMTVADGEILGLVCPNPADAKLVTAALHGGGHASIGGRELTKAGALAARSTMLVQPHHIDLFEGTLREQVQTASPDLDDAGVNRALAQASAADLLPLLPEGLDSRIVDGGKNLSGGQRQRVALARALAALSPILVLQDPTTAVDAVTEQRIAEGITSARRLPGLRTLLVATAPALLNACDRVVFTGESGISTGTHQELLENPDYAKAVLR